MIRWLALRAALFLAFAFLLAPVCIVIIVSFNGGPVLSFPPTHFTTHWYALIKPEFFAALNVSLIVAGATALLSVALGLPAALALSRGRFPGRDGLNSILLSPLVVPALVTGVALYQFSLTFWDFTNLALGGTLIGLIIGHLTFGIPFSVRAILAGHARFDYALEEAALNLGADLAPEHRRRRHLRLRDVARRRADRAVHGRRRRHHLAGPHFHHRRVRFRRRGYGHCRAYRRRIRFADAGTRPTHRPRLLVRREAVILDRRRNV